MFLGAIIEKLGGVTGETRMSDLNQITTVQEKAAQHIYWVTAAQLKLTHPPSTEFFLFLTIVLLSGFRKKGEQRQAALFIKTKSCCNTAESIFTLKKGKLGLQLEA